MHGKQYSPEFIAMQFKDKFGPNNPQFGVIKSAETVAKLTKPVYVYDAASNTLIGVFKTVDCPKYFKIVKDTIYKHLKNGLPFNGNVFTRTKR